MNFNISFSSSYISNDTGINDGPMTLNHNVLINLDWGAWGEPLIRLSRWVIYGPSEFTEVPELEWYIFLNLDGATNHIFKLTIVLNV